MVRGDWERYPFYLEILKEVWRLLSCSKTLTAVGSFRRHLPTWLPKDDECGLVYFNWFGICQQACWRL